MLLLMELPEGSLHDVRPTSIEDDATRRRLALIPLLVIGTAAGAIALAGGASVMGVLQSLAEHLADLAVG
jgi:hypothetical protein